jgi:hypothetical protein
MNRARFISALAMVGVTAAASAVPAHAFAPSVNWWTVDGGGNGYAKAGTYNLAGTSGQPDAGRLTGSPYTINGGFWGKGALVITAVEVPDPSTAAEDGATGAPKVARVLPAKPNPTGSTVRFSFELPNARNVEIRVYSVTGALVRTLARRTYPEGRHAITWDGRDSGGALVGQGLYIVQVRLGSLERSQKLLIVR